MNSAVVGQGARNGVRTIRAAEGSSKLTKIGLHDGVSSRRSVKRPSSRFNQCTLWSGNHTRLQVPNEHPVRQRRKPSAFSGWVVLMSTAEARGSATRWRPHLPAEFGSVMERQYISGPDRRTRLRSPFQRYRSPRADFHISPDRRSSFANRPMILHRYARYISRVVRSFRRGAWSHMLRCAAQLRPNWNA